MNLRKSQTSKVLDAQTRLGPLVRIRLREVFETSFSRSEKTNYHLWQKETGRTLRNRGDALCMVSRTGNQLVFIWKPTQFEVEGIGDQVHRHDVYLSVRARLDGRKWWDGRMLKNYAREVGLELVGLKAYEEYYDKAVA